MATGRSQARTISGHGLHLGAPSEVTLRVWGGPIAFVSRGDVIPLADLAVARAQRSTTLRTRDGSVTVGMVEHLFAALAAKGIHHGLRIELNAVELPLLDGAAEAWCDLLDDLELPPGAPRCTIEREAEILIDDSRFRFTPSLDGARKVSVEFQTAHPKLTPLAEWGGSYEDFRSRIASARTFVSAKDLESFEPGKLASHAPPESVVVLTEDDVLFRGAQFSADEPARHKLLDLMGDLFLTGGPPKGEIHAFRPGHAANARAIAEACERGIVVHS